MNILYINHYAGGPAYGMEYRPYYLAREWVREGHVVRTLAASYSHVRSVQPLVGGWPIQHITTEMIDGIEYIWYPTPAYVGNGLGRVRNIWTFLRQVSAQAKKLAQKFKPDVVIASSTYPMDIWVARRIARLAKAKLVFEVHDLWPLSLIELGGMSPSHPFVRLCQMAENAAYRDADVVISMLPKVADHMAAHGLDLRKLSIVPNGISPDEWWAPAQPLNENIAALIADHRRQGCEVVGYAGSHGVPNALNVLLDAAYQLRDEAFAFVLVGDGHEKHELDQRVHQTGVTNVAMFPPIPKGQIPSFLAAIDIAYIGWQREPMYRFGIAPNKLMDYMMAGRVVLHSVDAGNDPVAESGCGFSVPAESASAIAEGLRQAAGLSVSQRREMGERGKGFVLANHTYPVLARRFLNAVMSA